MWCPFIFIVDQLMLERLMQIVPLFLFLSLPCQAACSDAGPDCVLERPTLFF